MVHLSEGDVDEIDTILLLNGTSKVDIAQQLGIGEATIYRIVAKAKKIRINGL